jgi:membrane protein implicated in regulation of membrane protease activity
VTAWLTLWWVWAAAAIVFGIIEVLVPTYIFLGFTIGGAVMALIVGLGLLSFTPSWAFLTFAFLSLAGFVLLRLVLGAPGNQVKVITRDVNDN